MRTGIIAFAALVLVALAGCTTTRYVDVPRVSERVAHQRDTLAVRDSIYVHDSTVVSLRGDTVTVERFNIVYRDRWRDRLRVDSFVQRDTVTIVKEVEKPPSRWQQTQQHLGTTLLWMLVAAVAFVVYDGYIRAGK